MTTNQKDCSVFREFPIGCSPKPAIDDDDDDEDRYDDVADSGFKADSVNYSLDDDDWGDSGYYNAEISQFSNQQTKNLVDDTKLSSGRSKRKKSESEVFEPKYHEDSDCSEEVGSSAWPPSNTPGECNGSMGYEEEDEDPNPKRKKKGTDQIIVMGLVANRYSPWIDAHGKLMD